MTGRPPTPRPCGCPGLRGSRHEEDCAERGKRRGGPSGQHVASQVYRLPIALGDRVAELTRAGRSAEVLAALALL